MANGVATGEGWGAEPIAPNSIWRNAHFMTERVELETLERRAADQVTSGSHPNHEAPRSAYRPATIDQPLVAPVRLALRERMALRDPIAYAVEAPQGEIGFVTGTRIAPFAFWPDELIVAARDGHRVRVPVSTVSEVLPREGTLRLTQAPATVRPAPRQETSLPTQTRLWRATAVAGALLGVGSYVATVFALALGTGVDWAPGLAAGGAAAGAASAASWKRAGRSWLAAAGLGSFWLPLAAGVILSLVQIFR